MTKQIIGNVSHIAITDDDKEDTVNINLMITNTLQL